MIKILFVCHGSTAGSRELAAFVGQNGANHGIWERGVLRVKKRKLGLLFTVWESFIVTIRGDMQILFRKNCPSHLNYVFTECAENVHS